MPPLSSPPHLNLELFGKLSIKSYTELQTAPYPHNPLSLPYHSYLPHTSLINLKATFQPTNQLLFHASSFSATFTLFSTPLFHSCHLTRNRQFTLSIIWFILWSRSCADHCTKENFQHNIANFILNNKSFHSHWYLPFHLKSSIIHTLLKNFHWIRKICLITALLQTSPSSPNKPKRLSKRTFLTI